MTSRFQDKRVVVATCFLLAACLLWVSGTYAQTRTHIVTKGDTLWSISEYYYGDPDLWPKLWQMNPFITNPHLLNPGDVVTLLEEESLRAMKPPRTASVKRASQPVAPAPSPARRIDISRLTDLESLGYLLTDGIQPVGRIYSGDSKRLILSEGDRVIMDFGDPAKAKPGMEVAAIQVSSKVPHPLTGKDVGAVVSLHGRIVVNAHLKNGFYDGRITTCFREVTVGDPLLPYDHVSGCIVPLSCEKEIAAHIVAAKAHSGIIAKNSVVYLDRGLNHGIIRGQLFEVVRIRKIQDREITSETLEQTLFDLMKVKTLSELFSESVLDTVPMGIIMVVNARQDTSTALVLSATESFGLGSIVRGLSWTEEPEILSAMPFCPTE
ncbi:MAG: LysM peptidoglycan-binding domain-containing protein [Deltaproteobacteria bacterium]|nr:LysM peptidoglycan-binding domain-containing protein [Deltaproteobacteria bacterium]